ncbi:hypothetical protein HN588_07415 [Candidatus Bathyarchaeota archaeon]|jgi:hypothetical protein|nr:hypothetical protein [Candidatus Bathyarchaeota archaeon]
MANFRADPITTETIFPVSGSSAGIAIAGKTVDVTTAGAAIALVGGAPAAVTGSNTGLGIFWVSSSVPTTPYFRQSDGVDVPLSSSTAADPVFPRPFWKHMDWPEGVDQGGNEIQYTMWFPVSCSIISVRALMALANSSGLYTLSVMNNTDSVLGAATFDMNSLANGAVTSLALTSSSDYKSFDPGAKMVIALSSSDVGFDGAGTFLSIFAEEVT